MEMVDGYLHRIQDMREAGAGNLIIRFERKDLQFLPGQYLCVGIAGQNHLREYTIFSGIHQDYLEILVRIIHHGLVSPRLAQSQIGEYLHVEGPFGHFSAQIDKQSHCLALASGTGISPFSSLLSSYPNLDCTILWGARTFDQTEAYSSAKPDQLIRCISRGPGGEFSGRVTDWLTKQDLTKYDQYLLCGNCDMIYDAYGILLDKGKIPAQIHTEVYF